MLAEPIVRLLYERGRFDAQATTVVAGSLAAFSIGLTFNGTMLLLNRAFFSLQSNWLPTLVALGNLALNAALDTAFYRLGVWGIPLATSLVNLAGTAALLLLLRRRVRRIEGSRLVASGARVLVASAGYSMLQAMPDVPAAAAVAAGFAAYLPVALVKELARRRANRIERQLTDAIDLAAGTLQGRFPQIGGVAFSWDPDFTAGARVMDVALIAADGSRVGLYDNGTKLGGAPAKISVVTLNYLANVAPQDGTVLTMLTQTVPMEQALGEPVAANA